MTTLDIKSIRERAKHALGFNGDLCLALASVRDIPALCDRIEELEAALREIIAQRPYPFSIVAEMARKALGENPEL